jgi:hypothetical protein
MPHTVTWNNRCTTIISCDSVYDLLFKAITFFCETIISTFMISWIWFPLWMSHLRSHHKVSQIHWTWKSNKFYNTSHYIQIFIVILVVDVYTAYIVSTHIFWFGTVVWKATIIMLCSGKMCSYKHWVFITWHLKFLQLFITECNCMKLSQIILHTWKMCLLH